jgi:hypothetical protein
MVVCGGDRIIHQQVSLVATKEFAFAEGSKFIEEILSPIEKPDNLQLLA